MFCSARSFSSDARSRARIPACTAGCSVLTRPVSISGALVMAEISLRRRHQRIFFFLCLFFFFFFTFFVFFFFFFFFCFLCWSLVRFVSYCIGFIYSLFILAVPLESRIRSLLFTSPLS